MSIHLHPDELIFHKVGDDIISAGFGINSILLRRGLPEMLAFSTNNETNGVNPSLFRSFKNLAVPFGLFTSNNYNKHPPNEDAEYMGSIPDSLHDTLINHATYKSTNLTKKKKPKPTNIKHNNKSAKKRNKK